MSIISKETWDKFTEEEKEDIRHFYNGFETMQDRNIEGVLNSLFGKENLQPEPKIKTWEEFEKNKGKLNVWVDTIGFIPEDNISKKAVATIKIAKLIELGYGGMVTEEEWENTNIEKYCVYVTVGKIHYDGFNTYDCHFIAFHTPKQREEFMSYASNRKLVEQYYMI